MNLIKELLKDDKTEYVARLTDETKEKLNSGEWSLGIRKETDETYAVIKDTVTGKNLSMVTLDEKVVDKIGNLPELSAIQNQLADISKQIESLNQLVERVEQGQYNDRYAGFFSARQMVVEALASTNEDLKKSLLTAAIQSNNETIAKLMLAIYVDAKAFIDTKTKPKEAKRIDNLLHSSIGYLNASVQLNIIAYTTLGEQQSLIATLSNYQAFINQTLLKEIGEENRTIAWKIDNAQHGVDGKFTEISTGLTDNILVLIDDVKNNRIGALDYGKNETKSLQNAQMSERDIQ
ncbi:hypothetical protein ACTQ54_05350 [Fundicoccus sp. Sow4_H7]|uniref:hypothetical protein n=1 Tax=Fundicoccus sp. Sow4_H7 TaxID=3438784 RepID=UPI003F91323F